MEKHKKELQEKGYTIFRNLLSEEEVNEYKSEFREFTLSKLKPYVKVSERATNDFKKRGCYYF